jgi:hypothetical protein
VLGLKLSGPRSEVVEVTFGMEEERGRGHRELGERTAGVGDEVERLWVGGEVGG